MATHKPTEVRTMKKLLVGLTVLLLHTAAAHAQQILPEPVPPQVTAPAPPPAPAPAPAPAPQAQPELPPVYAPPPGYVPPAARPVYGPPPVYGAPPAYAPRAYGPPPYQPYRYAPYRYAPPPPTTPTHPRSPSAMFSIARSHWAAGSGSAVSSSRITPPGTRSTRTVSPTPSAWDSGWNRGCCCCGTSRAPPRTTDRRRSPRRRTCWRCRSS